MVHGHRVFAALWDAATRREDRAVRSLRGETAGSVSGRVLEIGVGTGSNWAYLPDGIEYIGAEPDEYMRARAARHAQERHLDHTILEASAESLPFDDASFDTVLVTFTFCSVEDPQKALAETYRVLRPGGALHYAEHVRPGGIRGRMTDVVTPAWSRLFGNCHPNRATGDLISQTGFVLESERRTRLAGLPVLIGVARKPA